jgi:hypothetical protein
MAAWNWAVRGSTAAGEYWRKEGLAVLELRFADGQWTWKLSRTTDDADDADDRVRIRRLRPRVRRVQPR